MQIQLTSEITWPYSTTSVISGLFYTHAKYDKKITRSRRGIWADIPRYAYRKGKHLVHIVPVYDECYVFFDILIF